MGWGTQFNAEIYISKEIYHTKYDVESEIKDLEEWITKLKAKIMALALATPRDIVPHDNDPVDPIFYVTNEIENLFESLEEDHYKLYKLRLLLDNWDNIKLDEL